MTQIDDGYMQVMREKARPYTVVILRKTRKAGEPGADKIVWEHGRRNFALRRDGILRVVCPVRDETDVAGVGIFSASVEQTRKIMDEDPAVKTGIFVYETHPTRSLPGDAL